jgi:hypothetical protein
VRRDSRTVSHTGATILVVLAALLHLMGCAHGPASPAVGDTLLTGPVAVATAHADSDHDSERHCCHEDEPTILASRDTDVPAPSAVEAASVTRVTNDSAPAPWPDLSSEAPVDGLSMGRSLACLGVLRT